MPEDCGRQGVRANGSPVSRPAERRYEAVGTATVREQTAALVAGGQACFLGMMAWCLTIQPSALAIKRGLSFYGNEPETLVPYSLGFALCIGLTALALARLRSGDAFTRRLRTRLAALVSLMAFVPLTPYSVDLAFDYLHIGVSALLFIVGFVLGAWLALRVLDGLLAWAPFSVQLAAGVLALTAQLGWHDYMIPSQLAFQVALAVLVVAAIVKRLPRPA